VIRSQGCINISADSDLSSHCHSRWMRLSNGRDARTERFYHGAAWSGADIRDLKWLLENGTSIEEVARLLRRATNVLEAKARELGLEVWHDSAAKGRSRLYRRPLTGGSRA
jgi:hypothetical protein